MPLNKETVQQVIANYRRSEEDTGSPEVQIALLSTRISGLTSHFQTYKKDLHGQRGLTKLVSQRRKLLDYLKRVDISRYSNLIERLGLRR